MKNFDLLIFDLDGTLIDSRRDLVSSINLMLQEYGVRALPPEKVVRFIGRGVRNLVKQSLEAAGLDSVQLDTALNRFASIYSEHLLDTTVLYPAVAETLLRLAEVNKVILSNKSFDFILKILQGLEIAEYFPLIIGGDTFPFMKPSREPIDFILEHAGVQASRSMIIGDSETDILAGKSAGIKNCGVLYGLTEPAEILDLNPDFTIEQFSGLIEIVGLK